MRDKITGNSRGFGFVKYVDPATAEKVTGLKDLVLDGRPLEPKPAGAKKGADKEGIPARSKKIFVGGLSLDTTEDEFKKHFGQYGKIVDAVVMVDGFSGRSRGFGFVEYDNEEPVDAVLLQDHVIGGKKVDCKRAIPKQADAGRRRGGPPPRGSRGRRDYDDYYGRRDDYYDDYYDRPPPRRSGGGGGGRGDDQLPPGPNRKLFVSGIPSEATEEQFKEYFKKFGNITEATGLIMDGITGRPKGFGFVVYETDESVEAALKEEQHLLGGKKVEVKRSVNRRRVDGPSRGRGGRGSGGGPPPPRGPRGRRPPPPRGYRDYYDDYYYDDYYEDRYDYPPYDYDRGGPSGPPYDYAPRPSARPDRGYYPY